MSAPLLRPDLEVLPRQRGGRRTVTLVDPIAGRMVEMTAEDHRRLQSSLASGPGAGGAADAAADRALWSEALTLGIVRGVRPAAGGRSPFNPLAIRLPGIDADGVAARLARHTDWLFSPRAVVAWGVLVLVALAVVLSGWERFAAGMPRLQEFFGPQNWLPLLLTLAVTKVLHELAHGTVCRRLGARCREIGVLLLCGTPCLYCDVSDSWRIASPSGRAAIMLAGIYLELILAAVASLLWWCTDPGWLHYGALNVMVVCSLSTLLFNANPLMRFDGYYVLADSLGTPDLRSAAADAWRRGIVAPLGGRRFQVGGPARWDGGRGALLALYHAASTSYRWVATAAIASWIVWMGAAGGVWIVGLSGAALLVGLVALGPMRAGTRVLRGRGPWQPVPLWRRLAVVGLPVAIVALVLLVPLSQRIHTVGSIDADAATTVYVRESGRVAEVLVDLGQRVEAGDPLVRLEAPELELEASRLAARGATLRTQIDSLQQRALDDPLLLESLEGHQAALRATAQQQQLLERRRELLVLRAPRAGIVLPTSVTPAADHLHAAHDRTLEPQLPQRLGALAREGTAWCRVANPAVQVAVMELTGDQRQQLVVGAPVRLRCRQNPDRIVHGRIASISSIEPAAEAARGDAAGPPSIATDGLAGRSRFQMVCSLQSEDAPHGDGDSAERRATVTARWQIGASVTGMIFGERLSLAERGWRAASEFLRARS